MQVNRVMVFSLFLFVFSAGIIMGNSAISNSNAELMRQLIFEEKLIVVLIPSFNNIEWYKANIDSVLQQKYQNYRVIYIDDCSTDGMSDLVPAYLDEHDPEGRWLYVRNPQNYGAMYNLYHAIHACPDRAIIVTLDGDDWFKHDEVLARVNTEYADESVWMTYGQFEWWPYGKRGHCRPLPLEIRRDVYKLRRCCGYATHLRTFYAWLFKKIKHEDLLHEGKFYSVAWDYAMLAPMLEMASPNHFRCIGDILYVYNATNPISDFRKATQLQFDLGEMITRMSPYQPLDITN